jgi:hypothetical protein
MTRCGCLLQCLPKNLRAKNASELIGCKRFCSLYLLRPRSSAREKAVFDHLGVAVEHLERLFGIGDSPDQVEASQYLFPCALILLHMHVEHVTAHIAQSDGPRLAGAIQLFDVVAVPVLEHYRKVDFDGFT